MSQFFSKGGQSDFFARENPRSTATGGGLGPFFPNRDQAPTVGSYDYRKRETNDVGTVGVRYKESVGNKDNRDQRNHQLASIMFMWEYEGQGASLFRKRCEDYVLMRQGKLQAANAEGVANAIKQGQINPKVVHPDLAKSVRGGGATGSSWYNSNAGFFGNNATSGTSASTWGGNSSFFTQGQTKDNQGYGGRTGTGTVGGSSWFTNTAEKPTWGQNSTFFSNNGTTGGGGTWGKPAETSGTTQSSISNFFGKKPGDTSTGFFGTSTQASAPSNNYFGNMAGRPSATEPPKTSFFKTGETTASGASGGFFGNQNSTQPKPGGFFGQQPSTQSFGNQTNFFNTSTNTKTGFFSTPAAQNSTPTWGAAKPSNDFFSRPAQPDSSNFFSFNKTNTGDFFSRPADNQQPNSFSSFFGGQNGFWPPQGTGPFPSAGMPAYNPLQAPPPYMYPPGYYPYPGYPPGIPPMWPAPPYPPASPNQSILEQKKEIVSSLQTNDDYKFNLESQLNEDFRRKVIEAQHQTQMIKIVQDALGSGQIRPEEIDISIRMPTFPSRNSSIRKAPVISSAIKSRLASSVSPTPIRGRDSKPKPEADNQSLSSGVFSSKNKISSFPSLSSINRYAAEKESTSQFRFKAQVSFIDSKFFLDETSLPLTSTIAQMKFHLIKMLPPPHPNSEELFGLSKISLDNGIYPESFRLKDVPKIHTRQVYLIIDARSNFRPEMESIRQVKVESQEDRSYEKKRYEQKKEEEEEEEENIAPILTKTGYMTKPSIKVLSRMSRGELEEVHNFSIANEFGKISWEEPVNLVGANLDLWVQIRRESIDVYPEDLFDITSKPDFGTGLNKPACITLNGIRPKANQNLAIFEEKLKEMCQNQNAEFVKYDHGRAKWKFKVKHF